MVLGGPAEAAALKLVANGVLGDSLSSLRRALARGEALGLPRDAVLDVVGRSALGRFVDGRRDVLDGTGARPPATFAAGALAKDLALLARSTDTTSDASVALDTLVAAGAVEADDDISVLAVAEQDLAWLADARLDVSPEVVADVAVLRPLHAYALTHATGDPAHLPDAFLRPRTSRGTATARSPRWTSRPLPRLFTGPGCRTRRPAPAASSGSTCAARSRPP